AAPFHYCGSVGLLEVGEAAEALFARIGTALTAEIGLRGLFGVDCVLRDGVPYPVEVNPRYTASVEVLEHAAGIAALPLHLAACGLGGPLTPDPSPRKRGDGGAIVGKAILFARQAVTMPQTGLWSAALAQPLTGWRDFADLPHPGERIEHGRPVMTF